MQGKTKWFSEEKSHGYIVGNDGNEYFFHIRDIKGTDLPRNGDTVSFDVIDGQKGPKATAVKITERANANSTNSDQRETCDHCGKKMMPRVIASHGEASHSVCPFCGRMHRNFQSNVLGVILSLLFIAAVLIFLFKALA